MVDDEVSTEKAKTTNQNDPKVVPPSPDILTKDGLVDHCKRNDRYPQTKLFQTEALGSCRTYQPCNDHDRQTMEDFLDNLDLSHVRHYLQFWGQARTGHSWIGSIIDAAPDALVANEFGIWKNFESMEGRGREGFLKSLARNSFMCGLYGRLQVYDYTIPNESQGLVGKGHRLTLMGDKTGQHTSKSYWQLGAPWKNETIAQLHRDQYHRLQALIGTNVQIKNVAVLRNPFDMIATQVIRGGENSAQNSPGKPVITIEKVTRALEIYRQALWAMENLDSDWFAFRMEAFALETEKEFREMCAWLEITCSEQLIATVVKETHHTVHATRNDVEWTIEAKDAINEFIQTYFTAYYELWE